MKKYSTLKTELLKNPYIKEEYERLAPQFDIASQIIELRKKKGISQTKLAELVGTKQSAIARIESGNYNPSLQFLDKIAVALGVNVTLRLG